MFLFLFISLLLTIFSKILSLLQVIGESVILASSLLLLSGILVTEFKLIASFSLLLLSKSLSMLGENSSSSSSIDIS